MRFPIPRKAFQSTPPSRGATLPHEVPHPPQGISIHAPLAGGDAGYPAAPRFLRRFQSTPPSRGATAQIGLLYDVKQEFQSTPPSRGATGYRLLLTLRRVISIHAPLAGGDRGSHDLRRAQHISIHAPLAGGDLDPAKALGLLPISIHAPLAGGDGMPVFGEAFGLIFQSTPPSRGATAKTAK